MPLFISDEKYIALIVKADHKTQTKLVAAITKKELRVLLLKPYQINENFPTLLHFIAYHNNYDMLNEAFKSLNINQEQEEIEEKEDEEEEEIGNENEIELKALPAPKPKLLDSIINLKTSKGETLLDLLAHAKYFNGWDELSDLISPAELHSACCSRDTNNITFIAKVAASRSFDSFLKAQKEIFTQVILQMENTEHLLLAVNHSIDLSEDNVGNFNTLMEHLPKPVFDKMVSCQPADKITFLTLVLEQFRPEFFDSIAERIADSDWLTILRHCTPDNPSTTLLFLAARNKKAFNYLLKKLDRKELNDIFALQVSLGQASMQEISKYLDRDSVLYLEKTIYPHLLAALDLEEIWGCHLKDPQEKAAFIQRYRPIRQFINQAELSITENPKELVAYFQELLAEGVDDYVYWEESLRNSITIAINQNNFVVSDALYVLLARINFNQYLANNNFDSLYLHRMYAALFSIRDSDHLNASDNQFVGESLTALGFPSEPTIEAGVAVNSLIDDEAMVGYQKMYPEIYRTGLVHLQAAEKLKNKAMKATLQVPFSIFTSDDRLEEKSATSTLTEKINALDDHIEYLETLGWEKFCSLLQLAHATPDSQLNTALIQQLFKKKLAFEMTSLEGKIRIGEEIVSLLQQGLTLKPSTYPIDATLFGSITRESKSESDTSKRSSTLGRRINIIMCEINVKLVLQRQERVTRGFKGHGF